MKKLLFLNIVFLIIGVQVVHAQKERIENLPNFDKKTLHFGYYLGVNANSFKVSYIDQSGLDLNSAVNPYAQDDMFVSVKSSLGFNIGFVIDYKLHKNVNLRFEPGLMSNTKELTFINANTGATDSQGDIIITNPPNSIRKISGTYMHLPLLLKFSTNRLNNFRPYIIGGASYDYNFSSNQNNGDDNYDGEFRMKTHSFMYEVGLGVDLYFSFFKFTPSIRGVFAIKNELVPDNIHHYSPDSGNPYSSPWTGPIDFLGTRGIFLHLAFH